jgi:HEAT repeats
VSDDRESLYRLLAAHPEEALAGLRALPDGMTGEPPAELVEQLLASMEPESPYHRIALEWEREPMGEALWKALQQDHPPETRRTAAWLVKRFPSKTNAAEIAEGASRADEDVQVRLWLVGALDLLAFGGKIAWNDLKPVFERLLEDPEAVIRESAAGALGSFPPTEEIVRLLSIRTADPCAEVAETARYVLRGMRAREG